MKFKAATRKPVQEDDSAQSENDDESIASKTLSQNIKERRKILHFLSLNILNFQRAMISSRRKTQQRIRRRNITLRGYYLQQLLDVQATYLKLALPLFIRVHKSARSEENLAEKNSPYKKDEKTPAKSVHFYEDIVSGFSTAQWSSTFRMSQRTFHWLCAILHESMKPNGVNCPLKNLIPLQKRVALGLYAFATGADYREIAALFDVSRASVCKYIRRFAESIVQILSKHLIAMPTTLDEYDTIRKAFHVASNMPPLVVGVLAMCELPVNPILESDTILYRKESGQATVILQALVDDKLLFRNIDMTAKSPNYVEDKAIAALPPIPINGRKMSSFVVAPSRCYSLQPRLLRRFDGPIVPHEYDFNDAVDQILEFKDNALRRLFGRWHILHRKCDLEPKTMKFIALACCILHNLLEEGDDIYSKKWEENVDISKFTKGIFRRQMKDLRLAMETRNFLARTISSTEM